MVESVRNAFSLPDLRRRILFTVFMLVIYRLVSNIPVPGVNLVAWANFTSGTQSNGLIEILNLDDHLGGNSLGDEGCSLLFKNSWPVLK